MQLLSNSPENVSRGEPKVSPHFTIPLQKISAPVIFKHITVLKDITKSLKVHFLIFTNHIMINSLVYPIQTFFHFFQEGRPSARSPQNKNDLTEGFI